MINYLNSINKQIQFTLKFQKKILNFLDLTLTIVNKKFNFSLYRKSNQICIITLNNSNHLYSQKISYLNSIFDRLKRIH